VIRISEDEKAFDLMTEAPSAVDARQPARDRHEALVAEEEQPP